MDQPPTRWRQLPNGLNPDMHPAVAGNPHDIYDATRQPCHAATYGVSIQAKYSQCWLLRCRLQDMSQLYCQYTLWSPIQACTISKVVVFHCLSGSIYLCGRKKYMVMLIYVDLSYPVGTSINLGIPTDTCMERPYPSLDTFVSKILETSRSCHIFKVDIAHAFRHLKICPLDYPLYLE